jgi:hypothetical protein
MDDTSTLERPLGEAFDRLEDFLAVWSEGVTLDAVERLQESVGVNTELRRMFADRLERMQPHAPAAAVLLGLLLGLSAAELRGSMGA